MRLNEIASGSKMNLTSDSTVEQVVEKYIPIIESKCGYALNEIKKANNRFIYRGTQTALSDAFYARTRNDRNPVNLSNVIQVAFDNMFKEHGFSALRSNSIYCTGALGDTVMYGKSFIIFPVDGFHFTWSPKIDDLMFRIKKYFGVRSDHLTQEIIDEKFNNELFKSLDFKQTDLAAAILSKNEILISGEYFAFDSKKYGSYFMDAFIKL